MTQNVPKHLAIIMDGNGRWATARGLPREAGHKAGAEALKKVARVIAEKGIQYLTLYAFSKENWNRPQKEVDALMDLFRHYLKEDLTELSKQNAAIHFIGDRTRFPADIQQQMAEWEAKNAPNAQLHLILALGYSGRDEMTTAAKRLAEDVKAGILSAESITEDVVSSYLATADFPDPDLLIRTGGECRLSNFLLWQMAYTELYFTPVFWPDFDEKVLEEALTAYATRDRRFGRVKENETGTL